MKGALLAAIPLTSLKSLTANQAKILSKLGLKTLQDLLLHLPSRYEDRTQLAPISTLNAGSDATISGEIICCQITVSRRRMLICQVGDGSGQITLRFFNFHNGMKNNLQPGTFITAFGEVRVGQQGLEMIHPDYLLQQGSKLMAFEATLTPIYPTTEGLRQVTLRKLIDQALALFATEHVAELLPAAAVPNLMPIAEAIQFLHRPPAGTHLADLEAGQHPAQQRLIIEELVAHNLSMLAMRKRAQHYPAHSIKTNHHLSKQLLAQLPFRLTAAQQRVVAEIEQDLAKPYPMLRLVQGDVGSGKTLVAALAALNVIAAGRQVALMAPTELLAEQHLVNFNHWFSPMGITVGWLAGKQKGKARQVQQNSIASSKVKMVIGTHALFQSDIKFKELALVIIDEQHRFGVNQRIALQEKGEQQGFYPHQLTMTATPIPRTLAMTAYADLDTSLIDELPPGRTAVTTVVVPDTRRQEIIERMRIACQQGRQAYWVCTLIEESELLAAEAAEVTSEFLQTALTPIKVGLLHGRMNANEKQQIMQRFKLGEIQLLVATTVIEVGVDVPNASLMVIENSERLGLAQLHQLRGRVGRGAVVSHCVLVYHPPLGKISQQRLHVLRESNDGFVIAQHDLTIRGPGELLGTRQTGNARFRVANLIRDERIIPDIQRIAIYLQQNYPAQSAALIERWVLANNLFGRV